MQLDLTEKSQWGGARAGAGRKPGERRRDPHRRRAALASRYPCHVTLKVRRDVHQLRSAKLVNELERTWREACERGRFPLLGAGRPCASDRRGEQRAGSGLRPQVDRSALCAGRESRMAANGCRSRRPLPRSRPEDTARGQERGCLRPAQRAPSPGEGRPSASATRSDRSGIVGALVLGLA